MCLAHKDAHITNVSKYNLNNKIISYFYFELSVALIIKTILCFTFTFATKHFPNLSNKCNTNAFERRLLRKIEIFYLYILTRLFIATSSTFTIDNIYTKRQLSVLFNRTVNCQNSNIGFSVTLEIPVFIYLLL